MQWSTPPGDLNTAEMDDQQLYGGTQSALSRTLLLWKSGCRLVGAPCVEILAPMSTDVRW
jgi:hypothetical protein